MQRAQIDFLNHGLLPFVGRSDELERIARFWSGTADAPGLRAMLILGEAGIGKSRLIEEASTRVTDEGGTIVYTRLYPDSSSSLVLLLARALARSATAQLLLKSEPEETIASVTAALIRICSLRPTLLIIEDLHLLAGDAVRDFTALADRLADEPISVIATARPIESPARALLERFLVEEMPLGGLATDDVTVLCERVFGERLEDDILNILIEKTTGNSLALRSALRAGIRPVCGSGARMGGARPAGVTSHVDHAAFVGALERNVRLLSEGMVAHLTPQEKAAAQALSMLGEVFARETAQALLLTEAPMLEVLAFKGIITASATPPPPLTATASRHQPMAFTHSLLHRHFADNSAYNATAVVTLLANNLPLYSLSPFAQLARHAREITAGPEIITGAIHQLFAIQNTLDRGRNWAEASKVGATAEALFQASEAMFGADERNELEALVLINQLQLQRRLQLPNFPELLDRLLALTESPANAHGGMLRMRALVFKRRYVKRRSPAECLQLGAEVDELLERFPELEFSQPYVSHLRESVTAATMITDSTAHREVERRLERLMHAEQASDAFRFNAWRTLAPHFLSLVDSREELEQRDRLIAELEATATEGDSSLMIWKIAFHFLNGRFDQVETAIEGALPVFKALGFQMEIVSCRLLETFARIAINGDARTPIPEIESMYVSLPEQIRHNLEATAPAHFVAASLLVGDTEAAIHYVAALHANVLDFQQPERIALYALATRDTECLRRMLETNPDPDFSALIAVVLSGEATDQAQSNIEYLLRPLVLSTDDLIQRLACLAVIAEIDTAHPALGVGKRNEARIHECLLAMLEWLHERALPAIMRPLLDRHDRWLTKAEAKAWRSNAATLGKQRQEARIQTGVAHRTHVSLFGAISVQKPEDESAIRIRGTQLCALLGLMAADHMLSKPLTAQEFAAIVFGSERDPDSVRKSMNFAVFRLREALGADAISTTGETPRLNPEIVRVDLVEAHHHLAEATAATRDGALMRALPDLIAALKISGGQVPFPTLYDEFFEAAREDFESGLRTTTIKLARALKREGDSAAAEEILRLAFAAMPDDEEIAELLQEALIAMGKRTEAKRIGMRVELAE